MNDIRPKGPTPTCGRTDRDAVIDLMARILARAWIDRRNGRAGGQATPVVTSTNQRNTGDSR